MKYPYVIIDSDPKASNAIQIAFENHCDYRCTGIAKTEKEGLNMILERSPKLVFLEVETPGTYAEVSRYTIINELKKYLSVLPSFIVVTKTIDYAVEGIRHQILDYVLKPLDNNALLRAIMRHKKDLVDHIDNTICFKSYGDYRFVNLDEVLYLKADSNTTDFILYNGQTVEAFKTLKHFQNTLPEHFVRIHNSYIVNCNYISRIHFGKSKCTIKNLTAPIPFSKSYKNNVEEIKDILSQKSILQL